jgi:hypothetical protein
LLIVKVLADFVRSFVDFCRDERRGGGGVSTAAYEANTRKLMIQLILVISAV